jgi:hypothetical protein
VRSLRSSLLASATIVASLAVAGPSAGASAGNPVCTDPVPQELCGGRVFAEPLQSLSAITYAGAIAGLEALAAEHPEWITLTRIGASADDLDLLAVEVTAPADAPGAVPLAERKVALVNQSIHGNEPGGREGGLRYVEDLVTGRDADRTTLLGQVRLIQTFVNPDGWASGDHDHVQTGGGMGLWVRQNGEGDVHLAGDFGSGIDLNRQAPWPGPSRRSPSPVAAPEAQAYVEFVRSLAAESDIRSATDIHGEVTDAGALVMLSAGQYDLDEAMNQRRQGDAMVERLFAELEDSQASMLTQALGEYPAGKLIASSEFAGGGTDTGYFGDWVSMASGGDAASLSTIELYNFLVTPGVNSLTARKEVMQLYRDVVREILASMIEQAATEHDTALVGTGPVGWVDAHERVTDPVRGIEVSSAEFYEDLTSQTADGMVRLTPSEVTAETLAELDAVIVSRDELSAAGVAALRDFAAAGGRVVLTDTGVALADALFDGADLAPSVRIDGDARVDLRPGTGALLDDVRDDAFMLIEPLTLGYDRSLAGGENVPTWTVDEAAWTSLGGSAEILADGAVAGGTAPLGDGEVSLVGLLTPPVLAEAADPIDHGIDAYGVLDTGYLVLANALGGDLVTSSSPAVPGGTPIGSMTVAAPEPAPFPGRGARVVPALLALGLGAAATAAVARRDRAAA